VNLNLFEFDYDLTFMVFFLDAEERVYARYGGRDAHDADNRQSLDGLRYTMQSVLDMHGRQRKEFAPRVEGPPQSIRDMAGTRGHRCLHCHQVKEVLNRNLRIEGIWTREQAYRYPLPENLGFRLDIDRGNVVQTVRAASPAAGAGLKPGDILSQLGQVPIHSFADASYALDKAPRSGTLPVSWLRDTKVLTADLSLVEGWRKTDVSWRPSLRRMIPYLPLYGDDLTTAERQALGLTEKQLAFRTNARLQTRAKQAGFQVGDIIVGVDQRKLDLTVNDFLHYVQRQYLAGDTLQVMVLRNGKTLEIPLVLTSW
jgi:predicted metalloprotease with PDZ domain